MQYDLLKILIVDDSKPMRIMLSEIFRSLGCRDLRHAGDGAEAMQILRKTAVDIVVTDLAMAPVDGIAFVRELRNAPDSPNKFMPVIMITGHATGRRVAEARDAGVNEFLAKPITAAGVLDRLRRVITSNRSFAKSDDYFGPDRRRRDDSGYSGPRRRRTDQDAADVIEL